MAAESQEKASVRICRAGTPTSYRQNGEVMESGYTHPGALHFRTELPPIFQQCPQLSGHCQQLAWTYGGDILALGPLERSPSGMK